VYFQALDDKRNCIGIYHNGKLIFDQSKFPNDVLRTWKYSGSLVDPKIEYAWLYTMGKKLSETCPEHLLGELQTKQRKMEAFKRAFELAKIDFREHCFFEMVPHDFLASFLETKNKITQHVFENYEKPPIYEHLLNVEKLLYKIRYQELNVNNTDARNLFVNSIMRVGAQKVLKSSRFIDYNLFGTKTGRLSTHPGTFPILTMRKELRALVKPVNDWFISFDYNGAEARTVLGLLGVRQPCYDVHEWNIEKMFKNLGISDRDTAKTTFFAWLYNPKSDKIKNSLYDRDALLEQNYNGESIKTIFDREIMVDKERAVNYLIQSTTADLVNDRAVAIDEFLKDKKSFISHIVHDELVLDVSEDEKYLIPELKEMFSKNKLATYKTNLQAGKDYYSLGELNL
jgi:hypothetical protein